MMLLLLSMAMVQARALPPETWKERNRPDMPPLPACDLGRGAVLVQTIGDLPAAAAAELRRFFSNGGGIADADGAYNSTDVRGNDVPTRRFLRAYRVRNYWVIWFERGGFGTGQTTLALASRPAPGGGQQAYTALPGSMLSGNLCAASKALLDGVRSGRG